MSKKIFGWFAPKRGVKVLQMVEKHLEMTQQAVESLSDMIEAAAECKEQMCKKAFMDVSRLEMQADELRRQMVEELTMSEMFPEERDDLMELVRAVDWVADWSKEAARILNVVPFDKAPDEIKTATLNMVRADVDCVKVLTQCIKALPKNPKEGLSLANEVEMLEESVDDLYSTVRKHFAVMESPGFTVGAMILLNEFFDALETIADWCENTADIVRAIAVREH
jgi:predicted phosphate transport protein (TIGR00153 family)